MWCLGAAVYCTLKRSSSHSGGSSGLSMQGSTTSRRMYLQRRYGVGGGVGGVWASVWGGARGVRCADGYARRQEDRLRWAGGSADSPPLHSPLNLLGEPPEHNAAKIEVKDRALAARQEWVQRKHIGRERKVASCLPSTAADLLPIQTACPSAPISARRPPVVFADEDLGQGL